MEKFITLAQLLFQMEIESIGNDPEFHWEFNSWYEKFGNTSIMFEDKLISKEKDINDLAIILEKNFKAGEFEAGENGELYNYLMPTQYGNFIVERLEMQLADFTKVGTQMEFCF